MAAVAWLKLPEDVDQTTRIKSVSNGWWYTALLPNKKRIAIFHGLLDSVTKLVYHPTKFMEALIRENLISASTEVLLLEEKIQARDASVKLLKEVAQDHFLAVGDAALSFDPLSSQGIFFALYSGIKAAEAIIVSEQSNNTAVAFANYSKQVQQVFKSNEKSRAYFYNQETRYRMKKYWQQVS